MLNSQTSGQGGDEQPVYMCGLKRKVERGLVSVVEDGLGRVKQASGSRYSELVSSSCMNGLPRSRHDGKDSSTWLQLPGESDGENEMHGGFAAPVIAFRVPARDPILAKKHKSRPPPGPTHPAQLIPPSSSTDVAERAATTGPSLLRVPRPQQLRRQWRQVVSSVHTLSLLSRWNRHQCSSGTCLLLRLRALLLTPPLRSLLCLYK